MKTAGGFYISQIKQLQERIFDKLLNENSIDISGAQGRILYVLWQQDNLSMSEIGQRTSLANNTLTAVINRMVEKGILTRATKMDNRRQIIISLTDYAKSLEKSYALVSDKMNNIFYRGFSENEISSFESQLERILLNLKNCEGKGI